MTKAKRHSFKDIMSAVSHAAQAVRLLGYDGARKALEEVIKMDRLERRCRKSQEPRKERS